MRTVTFSQPEIKSLLAANFVCTYTNLEGDPLAGQSIKHAPDDPPGPCLRGNGEQNVQTIFLTPDQEIFHVVSGYISPQELSDEIDFALQIFEEIKSSPEEARAIVAQAHQRRLGDMGYSQQQINNNSPLAEFEQLFGGPQTGTQLPPGSGSRGLSGSATRIPTPGTNTFQAFIDRQIFKDLKFCYQQPLLSREELERDPDQLVGRGTTFFGSSSSGHQPNWSMSPSEMRRKLGR